MILGNYSVLNKNSGRSTARLDSRYQFSRVSPFMNFFTSEANAGRIPNASLPTGTQPPYSFVVAPKGGELSSTTSISGTGALTGAMSMGKAMTANLAGVGALIGSMSLVSSMSATLSGVGTLSGSVTVLLVFLFL